MFNSLLKRIERFHQRLDAADQSLRNFDGELRKVRHPLQGGFRAVEAMVQETDSKLKAVGSCATCARPSSSVGVEMPKVELPTREQTTQELKRRLAKEIYRLELDLANGLKIAGLPCDCGEWKHLLGIEAVAEELIPREPDNRVYRDVIGWLRARAPKMTVAASASRKYDAEYPQLAAEMAGFRKRVSGTEVKSGQE